MERVIIKVFDHYHCDVIVTDRLRAMFSSKLWRMGQAIRSRSGIKSHNLKERWKLTKWKIEFNDDEVVPHTISNKKNKML